MVIWGVFGLWGWFVRHNSKELRILEFSGDREIIKEVLKSFPPPFTMEIAVHQIGRDIHNYLIVPAVYLNRVLKLSGGKEVKDYNIYHPGGVNLGYSLRTKDNSSASIYGFLSLINKLDFSKVDEIGEGVMFQLVFGERPYGDIFLGHARVLISAPTNYQAREILESFQKEFSGCDWVEEKNQAFINAATYREFGVRKGMEWRV